MTYKIIKNEIAEIYADAVVRYASTGSSEIAYVLSDEPGSRYIFTADYKWALDVLMNECIKTAAQLGLYSIMIPVPDEVSVSDAVSFVGESLPDRDLLVILAVSEDHETDLPEEISSGIDEYLMSKLDSFELMNFSLKDEECSDDKPDDTLMGCAPMAAMAVAAGMSLDERVKHISDTWQETLFSIIDEKGYTDSEVYKKANVDRKLFSKIRSNPSYQPKKITAVAFALALELNLDESRDFIGRAGYAFSESSVFDLIIMYFIENKVFDIYQINLALFEHDQPTIGG